MKTLKECLYKTVHRNNKPLKQIAEEIGMSENYLTRSGLPDQEESETGSGCRFPLKKVIPLIRTTGDFSVLDFIELSLGRVAIVLPKTNQSTADICRLTMSSVKEFGHLMSETEAAVEDGHISDLERGTIVREGYHAVQAIMSLVKSIEKENEES